MHTVVSFDFAVGIVPGWHATIFPPYFVAGAIYAGFAMVLTLAIPLRKLYGLEDFITNKHLENMGKVMLATGLIVAYGYMMEAFGGYYSGNQYEAFMIKNRMLGPYKHFYWALIVCNVISPQFLWIKNVRKTCDRPSSSACDVHQRGHVAGALRDHRDQLHRDFLPSSWGMYHPTFWDWSTYIGTIGLFFLPVLPVRALRAVISILEMRAHAGAEVGGSRDRQRPDAAIWG